MGKEGDLWDDSALVNAFDDAMSKYKKMHGMHSKDYSTDIGNVAGNTVENASSNDATDCRTLREEADNNYATSGEMLELGEATNSVTDHGLEEYNQLLSQYYELEEKRQVILQKLHQLSGYDTQYPVEGSGSGQQGGFCSTSQYYLVPANQASLLNLIGSSCCCICHCYVAPCASSAACTLGGTCLNKECTDSTVVTNPQNSFAPVNDDISKIALGAAERAISSMKMNTSNISGSKDAEHLAKTGKEEETVQSTSSETDLSVVLNAWYSAGFYSGKYLTEQYIAKKRLD
ncbi:hypothetical protein K2173_009585 [Erythroxylum novogranatense]|uniref:Survival Motor Neuron Gemin2-binding domain-containing protein n=1 Tax=Erythroxylum novogranatense TaxID=1862640 RepID=A0AAV8U7I8_9ROSI|nr:hypothetical protein K2173_009585 [Erythroxylum novogranatense]